MRHSENGDGGEAAGTKGVEGTPIRGADHRPVAWPNVAS